MPTERFYRLPEEKKRTIQKAAVREFVRVPLDKVSINQIIKEAEISRGSFYTYFEDKWDVLAYVFEESQQELKLYFYHTLEEQNGNIWKTFELFFEKILEICSQEEQQLLIRNVMQHSDMNDLFGAFQRKNSECLDAASENVAREIYGKYSRTFMREMSQEEFCAFFMLAIGSMAMEVRRILDGKSLEELRRAFRLKLQILWQGAAAASAVIRTEELPF